MDNASYHGRVVPGTAAPTTNSTKEDMKKWLLEKEIPFSDSMYKAELYDIIKKNKPEKKTYVVDEMLAEYGHLVLRLPPYHCTLNPIELVWGIMKNDVARRNNTFKLADMNKLASDALEKISGDTVKNCFRHVKEVEDKYWKDDALDISPEVEEVVIDPEETDSASDGFQYSFSDTDL